MAGPPVYEDGFFELSIDPSFNSLDNTFKSKGLGWVAERFQAHFKLKRESKNVTSPVLDV
jgi:hypothetical protein